MLRRYYSRAGQEQLSNAIQSFPTQSVVMYYPDAMCWEQIDRWWMPSRQTKRGRCLFEKQVMGKQGRQIDDSDASKMEGQLGNKARQNESG